MFSSAALGVGAPKRSYRATRKTSNKEGGHSLIGFIAFCQSRSSNTKRGISRHPASILAPESVLASLPSVALSSAQVDSHSNQESNTFVALVNTEGVQKPGPNTCTVAGFEVITIGRFWGDNRGPWRRTRRILGQSNHRKCEISFRSLKSVVCT